VEAVARTTAPARLRTWIEPQPRALAAWALGFLPVVYLSLRGGGWDPVIRNEVGIPTIVGGRIDTRDEVNTIVAAGRADLCLMSAR